MAQICLYFSKFCYILGTISKLDCIILKHCYNISNLKREPIVLGTVSPFTIGYFYVKCNYIVGYLSVHNNLYKIFNIFKNDLALSIESYITLAKLTSNFCTRKLLLIN